MKFIILGKYTKQGTDGWLDNPDDDRRAMISSLSEKIGGKLIDLSYTKWYGFPKYFTCPPISSKTFATEPAQYSVTSPLSTIKSGLVQTISLLINVDKNFL